MPFLGSPFLESCATCGVLLGPADHKRRKRPSALRAAAEAWFVRTPLVSGSLLALCAHTPESVTIPLCMSCVHWLHRVQRRARGGRQLLPLDALLAVARLLRRLVRALTGRQRVRGVAYCNPYVPLLPPGVLPLLAAHAGAAFRYQSCVDSLAAHEWERHGGALVVGSKEEARRLRRLPAGALETSFGDVMREAAFATAPPV